MPKNILEITRLNAGIDANIILKNVNLELQPQKTYFLMGPNGSGKSTLAQTIMGSPFVKVKSGQIFFENTLINDLQPNERANRGLFLSFQYPSEIPGVTISNYLRLIYNTRFKIQMSPLKFRQLIKEKMDLLQMDEKFLSRYLNEGFSGGEKKKMEVLQLMILEPKLAILDELDSGLDIDALKIITQALVKIQKEIKMTMLIITHYTGILKYLSPEQIFIMKNGEIIKQGGVELAALLEKEGFAPFDN